MHPTPVALFGYHNDQRAEKAEVVIRRNNTGIGSSNDIGFAKQPDGSYKAIVSEYDGNALRLGLNRTPLEGGFVNAVGKAYGAITSDKALNTLLRKTIPSMKQRGIIPRHATVRTDTVAGARKVTVTY